MSRLRGFFPGFVLFLYLMKNAFAALLLFLLTTSCARQGIRPPIPPALEAQTKPETEQGARTVLPLNLSSSDWKGFRDTAGTVLPALDKDPARTISAGGRSFTAGAFSASLKKVLECSSGGFDGDKLARCVSDNFDILELSSEENRAFFTAYYVPEFDAGLKADDTYRYPLYSPPGDLVAVKLFPLGPDFRTAVFRGRIDEGKKLVSYYTRRDIDGSGALARKDLEIAYLKDPLDVLILQIQGSGRLVFGDGTVRLAAYAGKNGHPYRSIGRYMADNGMLPAEEVSWANIRNYLKARPETLEEVLYSNPSYVFFSLRDAGAVSGSLGLPLTPVHSIAVDKRHVPPLSLCLIALRRPVVGDDGLVKSFVPMTELAFAMDEGSAIQGPARVDIFLGAGMEAEKLAGTLRGEGNLYLLAPRQEP